MPTPQQNETQEQFIDRCIPIVIEDGTAEDGEQANAVCHSMWEQREKAGRGETMMERKTLEFKLTKFDFEGRTLEGYAAAFNNVDLGGDIIHRGAFAKTLAERGNKVKFLWQHDPGEPIGRPLLLQEDENGLFVKAIISPTARGNDALALLKDHAIDGLSIGYDAVKGGTDFERIEGGETVRNLKEIKLYEFSLVTFPMNESATVTGLKGARINWVDFWALVKKHKDEFDTEKEQPGNITLATEKAIKEMFVSKAGRVLSARNASRINNAIASLVEALDDAGIELDGFTRTPTVQEPSKTVPALDQSDPGGEMTTFGIKAQGKDLERVGEIVSAHFNGLMNDLAALYEENAPDADQAAEDGEKQGAGPSESPTLQAERLKLLVEIAKQTLGG